MDRPGDQWAAAAEPGRFVRAWDRVAPVVRFGRVLVVGFIGGAFLSALLQLIVDQRGGTVPEPATWSIVALSTSAAVVWRDRIRASGSDITTWVTLAIVVAFPWIVLAGGETDADEAAFAVGVGVVAWPLLHRLVVGPRLEHPRTVGFPRALAVRSLGALGTLGALLVLGGPQNRTAAVWVTFATGWFLVALVVTWRSRR